LLFCNEDRKNTTFFFFYRNAREYSFSTTRRLNGKNSTVLNKILAPPPTAPFTGENTIVFFYTNIVKYAYSTNLRLFESEIILLPSSIATPETKMLHRPLPLFVGKKNTTNLSMALKKTCLAACHLFKPTRTVLQTCRCLTLGTLVAM
jgi:hypothetical protein